MREKNEIEEIDRIALERMRAEGADMNKARPCQHAFSYWRADLAQTSAALLQQHGYHAQVLLPEDNDTAHRVIVIQHLSPDEPTLAEAIRFMEQHALNSGGRYEGWEMPIEPKRDDFTPPC